jgi:Tfp pilus assembly protein PilO
MKNMPWYGFLIICAIILLIFYLAHFKPKNQQLNSIKKQRIKVEAEVDELRRKKKRLDKIEAEIQNLNLVLAKLEAKIPKKRELSNILDKIQELAYDSRLNIKGFTPKDEIEKEFFLEWPIEVKVTGNYHNLAIFFDKISRFERLFKIENFSIRALQNQSNTTISASMIAKTYISLEGSENQQ